MIAVKPKKAMGAQQKKSVKTNMAIRLATDKSERTALKAKKRGYFFLALHHVKYMNVQKIMRIFLKFSLDTSRKIRADCQKILVTNMSLNDESSNSLKENCKFVYQIE